MQRFKRFYKTNDQKIVTPFQTIGAVRQEQGLKDYNDMVRLKREREKMFAKDLSKRMRKNVRIIKDRLAINPLNVQENQDCVLRIVNVFFDMYRELYGSKHFETSDETGEPLQFFVDDENTKTAYQPNYVKKEFILHYMSLQLRSTILPQDVKCFMLAKTVLENVSKSRLTEMSPMQLYVAMDLRGPEAMAVFTKMGIEQIQQTQKKYDHMIEYVTSDPNGQMDDSEIYDKLADVDMDGDELDDEDLEDYMNAEKAIQNVSNSVDDVVDGQVQEQMEGRFNVGPEVEFNDIQQKPEYAAIKAELERIIELKNAAKKNIKSFRALKINANRTYKQLDKRNATIEERGKELNNIKNIKLETLKKLTADLGEMEKDYTTQINQLKKESETKNPRVKITVKLDRSSAKLLKLIKNQEVKISETKKGIAVTTNAIASNVEQSRQYHVEKTLIADEINELDRMDKVQNVIYNNLTTEIARLNNILTQLTPPIPVAKPSPIPSKKSVEPAEPAQPAKPAVEPTGEGKKAGKGVLSGMDAGIKQVVGKRYISTAPANPELEGHNTSEFVSQFVKQPLTTLPPIGDLLKGHLSPPQTIPFNKKPEKETEEDKKSNIDFIRDRLEKMVKSGDIEKVTTEDMIKIISGVMIERSIDASTFTSTDISQIIRDFYKAHPEKTTEDSRPDLALELPENADDMYRLSAMLDWMVVHSGVKVVDDSNKRMTGTEAIDEMVKAMRIKKPEGKPANYPRYKWIFDRDLKNVTISGTNGGVKVDLSVPARFGITSLNSKFEKEYVDFLDHAIDRIIMSRGKLSDERLAQLIDVAELDGFVWSLVFVNDILPVIGATENEIKNLDAGTKAKIEDTFRKGQHFIASDYMKNDGDITRMMSAEYGALALAARFGVFTKNENTPIDPEMASLFHKNTENYIRGILEKNKQDEERIRFEIAYEYGASQAKKYPHNFVMQDINELNAYGAGKKKTTKAPKKPRTKKSGGAKVFKNYKDMMDRLTNLVDNVDMGNSSMSVRNEIMDIIDILVKSKKITKKDHKTIYEEYVKV